MEQTGNRPKSQSNLPDKSPAPANPITSLPTIAPKRPPFQGLMRGLVFLGTTAAAAALGLGAALMLPLPAQLAPRDQGPRSFGDLLANGFQYQVSRPVNVLILGIDRVPTAKPGTPEIFSGRSDTMLLLRVDPSDDSVRLLSIPRDTQVEIPNVGVTKINDANVRGGAILASKTVSSVLNGVVVDRYVRVSTDAFRELVDLLGGVDVYVPDRMVYEDKTQKLKINLSPGQQTLNGNEAEQFARFRQDSYGDIGRVQRQQALLKALRQRLTNPTVIPRVPALIGAMQKYIDTNLSPEEILALVRAGRKISQGDLKMVMLPGRFSAPGEFAASYWIMDPAGRDRVMQQFFNLDSSGKSDSTRAATSLRVAIQNASSQPDAAAQMRSHLAKLGFSNVYVASDWSDQQRQTQIVVQQGDLKSAEELKRLLGFGNIEADSTGDLESDLTIRVGEDWARQLKP